MDKALETTYTMRGATRVVRTEATGNATRTTKAHMRACKAAVAELHALSRDAWVPELTAEINRLAKARHHGEDIHGYEQDRLKDIRKRVAGPSFAINPPNVNLADWCKPRPSTPLLSKADFERQLAEHAELTGETLDAGPNVGVYWSQQGTPTGRNGHDSDFPGG